MWSGETPILGRRVTGLACRGAAVGRSGLRARAEAPLDLWSPRRGEFGLRAWRLIAALMPRAQAEAVAYPVG